MTEQFYCNICDYKANARPNLNAHFKSDKHKRNINCQEPSYKELLTTYEEYDKCEYNKITANNYSDKVTKLIRPCIKVLTKTLDDDNFCCTGCGKKFNKKRDYTSHTTSCSTIENKYREMTALCIDMAIELIQMREYIANIDSETNVNTNNQIVPALKKRNRKTAVEKCAEEFSKTFMNNGGNIIVQNSIINAPTNIHNAYSNTNYTKNYNAMFPIAPALEYQNIYIDKKNGLPYNYEKNKNKFGYDQLIKDHVGYPEKVKFELYDGGQFLAHYKENVLEKYVSDKIIASYKKNDPQEQSLWNTDAIRFTYILRVQEADGDNYWKSDPQAIEFKKTIIERAVQYITKTSSMYRAYHIQKYVCNKTKFIYDKESDGYSEVELKNIANKYIKFVYGADNVNPKVKSMVIDTINTAEKMEAHVKGEKFIIDVLKLITPTFYMDKKYVADTSPTTKKTPLKLVSTSTKKPPKIKYPACQNTMLENMMNAANDANVYSDDEVDSADRFDDYYGYDTSDDYTNFD